MTRTQFKRALVRAKTMREVGSSPEDAQYWSGYEYGLRRAFHGESFYLEGGLELWMALFESDDPLRAAKGRGFRDGFGFSPPLGRPTDEKRRHYDLSIRPSVMARVEALAEKEGLSRSAMVDRILAEATLAR